MDKAQKELPQYRSHKTVRALKIQSIIPVMDGSATIIPEDDRFPPFSVDAEYVKKREPKAGGYYVVYQDGYKSWSPAEAFEEGYTLVEGEV